MAAENVYRDLIQNPSDRVIIALDDMSWTQAADLMLEVEGFVGMGKINSLAQRKGWDHATETLGRLGAMTMADEKYHDIPKTAELECYEAAQSGPAFITVHASGGKAMMEAAVQGAENGTHAFFEANEEQAPDARFTAPTGILAITILTSLSAEECKALYGAYPEEKVVQLTRLAAAAGVDGVVCSGQELRAIRAVPEFDHLVTVVAGITPMWAKKANDQSRIITPSKAVELGADFIVVGRAITQPPQGMGSEEAACRVVDEIAGSTPWQA
jgi:orotidine-5'-phosphate decarboxylase